MNVYQVKNAINKTDCANYVYSGMFCSEPIMSKDETGNLIDNYIVFSRSDNCSYISAPECAFGIYTDKEQSVYINDSVSGNFQEHIYSETFMDEQSMRVARKIYLELFPVVRDMYQLNRDIDYRLALKYINSLKIISGNTLFGFYEKLFPSFFDWIEKLI